jgi:hypothetical protein
LADQEAGFPPEEAPHYDRAAGVADEEAGFREQTHEFANLNSVFWTKTVSRLSNGEAKWIKTGCQINSKVEAGTTNRLPYAPT